MNNDPELYKPVNIGYPLTKTNFTKKGKKKRSERSIALKMISSGSYGKFILCYYSITFIILFMLTINY